MEWTLIERDVDRMECKEEIGLVLKRDMKNPDVMGKSVLMYERVIDQGGREDEGIKIAAIYAVRLMRLISAQRTLLIRNRGAADRKRCFRDELKMGGKWTAHAVRSFDEAMTSSENSDIRAWAHGYDASEGLLTVKPRAPRVPETARPATRYQRATLKIAMAK